MPAVATRVLRPVAVDSDLPAIGSVEQENRAGVVEASGVDPITGGQVSLADYEGKPVVLNFWASWCPPCREELPALIELAERHPEVALVGVNYQDAAGDARASSRRSAGRGRASAIRRASWAASSGSRACRRPSSSTPSTGSSRSCSGGTDLAGFEEGVELIAPAAT